MSIWLVIQFLLFKAMWIALVIGQNDYVWLGAIILAIQIIYSPSKISDLFAMPLAVVGIAVDLILIWLNIFNFESQPYWLFLLWAGFVLSIGHSLKILGHLPIWATALIAGVAGSASYLTGWHFSAVELPLGPELTAIILFFVWSLLLPLLMHLDNRVRRQVCVQSFS